MTERDRVLPTLTNHQALLHSLGVRRIGLFGSRARGEARKTSDLDFLVEFESGSKTFDYMDLKALIEGLFRGSNRTCLQNVGAGFTPSRAGASPAPTKRF